MKVSLSSKVTMSLVLHILAVMVVALSSDVQVLHAISTAPAWVVLAVSGLINVAGQYQKRENNPPPSSAAALARMVNAQAVTVPAPPAGPQS